MAGRDPAHERPWHTLGLHNMPVRPLAYDGVHLAYTGYSSDGQYARYVA